MFVRTIFVDIVPRYAKMDSVRRIHPKADRIHSTGEYELDKRLISQVTGGPRQRTSDQPFAERPEPVEAEGDSIPWQIRATRCAMQCQANGKRESPQGARDPSKPTKF